ncbi:MAG: glycosyltransferase [Acidobacteriota bacterium]
MILYLCSNYIDYCQDLLYAGLAQCLGKERIVEYPHRRELHTPGVLYPFNAGLVPGKGRKLSWSELIQLCKQGRFKVIVVGSAKPLPLRNMNRIRHRVEKLSPQVLVDGGDKPGLGEDCPEEFACVENQRPFDLIFKRELKKDRQYPSHVFPLQMAANLDVMPPVNSWRRPHPVFWSMRPTSSLRRDIASVMEEKGIPYHGDGLLVTKPRRSPWRKLARKVKKILRIPWVPHYLESMTKVYELTGGDYLEALHQSRIALSIGGKGFDTLRYWEIPACGSMLLSERPSISIPNDFEDNKTAVFFSTPEEFLDKLNFYSSREDSCHIVARAGHEFLIANHTTRHRGRFFLKTVAGQLGVSFES